MTHKGMRTFNYSSIKEQKWDSEILGLIAAIYRYAGKQELYLKQKPKELEKLVEIAKIQSTKASNAIEGIVTTNTRIRQLVEEKTTPRNRDKQEIAGYRDVLNVIHERFDAFDAIPLTKNYILQLHKILYSHMNNPLAPFETLGALRIKLKNRDDMEEQHMDPMDLIRDKFSQDCTIDTVLHLVMAHFNLSEEEAQTKLDEYFEIVEGYSK